MASKPSFVVQPGRIIHAEAEGEIAFPAIYRAEQVCRGDRTAEMVIMLIEHTGGTDPRNRLPIGRDIIRIGRSPIVLDNIYEVRRLNKGILLRAEHLFKKGLGQAL